jgi:hypothetical protein
MTTRHTAATTLGFSFCLCIWAGCNAIAGITDGTLASDAAPGDSPSGTDGMGHSDGMGGGDGHVSDGGGSDAPTDSPIVDAPADVPPPTYHDMGNPTFWSTFDTGMVMGGGFEGEGATFDGRYVYFAPSAYKAATVAGRYDTMGNFTSASSWAAYDTGMSFTGAVTDGKYVYFVSNAVMRHDPSTGFTSASSWKSFGVPGADAGGSSLNGATFDGRYLYFAGAVTAAYDTTMGFTNATSWTTFATNQLLCSDTYVGAVFDGRFVYLVPNSGGCVARYDTQAAAFGSITSWDTFDLTGVSMTAVGFYGGAFDGRYVYFPQKQFGSPGTLVVRYDTQAGFGLATSWTIFDTMGLGSNPGSYTASAFDGRFLYFLQGYAGGAPGFIARYDSTLPFGMGGDGGSWEGLSTAAFNTLAWDFGGAAYDGRYLYLAPNFNSVAARLDTKTPPSMPNLPAFHGSFY